MEAVRHAAPRVGGGRGKPLHELDDSSSSDTTASKSSNRSGKKAFYIISDRTPVHLALDHQRALLRCMHAVFCRRLLFSIEGRSTLEPKKHHFGRIHTLLTTRGRLPVPHGLGL